MIQTGFRTYDVETNDFPIVITASTDAATLPDLAQVTFLFQNVQTGAVTSLQADFIAAANNTAKLSIAIPASLCNIVFALQVRFPASNPAGTPLKLAFVSADSQKAADKVSPGDLPIVFANYVMHFR